ncbi:MAG: RNA polymerase subunit sigma-70 [Flavobacteriales bacterium]|nr:MAG: RNA polymerase subunit sigma-70 [Flavobacteriales bacterium]
MDSEKQLIRALKNEATKQRAFKTLLAEYKERLYWHIRKIVIIHEDADDILQNTFIKIFKNINTFKAKSKLYSWMYRIATNEAITFINKKAKKQQISLEQLQQDTVQNLQADVYFNGSEIQLRLQQAIAKLPQKQRLVFNMKYFDEIKYEDMSEILETSVGALKASYHHAVKKIEAELKTNLTD